MKEVKQFSKSYIFVSALYVVLGIVLVVWPTMSLKMICYGLAAAMIVMGISYGIMYFTKDNLEGFLQMDLVIGIVCLAFGIFILLNPSFLGTVLPFAMGIILLLGAVVKIQSSINMKRLCFKRWYLVLTGALILAVLGIVLLCNPFTEERWRILYIGICLIMDGLVNLVSLVCIQVRVKTLSRLQKDNPDLDVKELLAERAKAKKPEMMKKPDMVIEPETVREAEVVKEPETVQNLETAIVTKSGGQKEKGQE